MSTGLQSWTRETGKIGKGKGFLDVTQPSNHDDNNNNRQTTITTVTTNMRLEKDFLDFPFCPVPDWTGDVVAKKMSAQHWPNGEAVMVVCPHQSQTKKGMLFQEQQQRIHADEPWRSSTHIKRRKIVWVVYVLYMSGKSACDFSIGLEAVVVAVVDGKQLVQPKCQIRTTS
mmetsp:Transcript_31774/g.73012  ORF Transcript_31774/g.73012 Transcript_31774/m.73012 type:complete len:171 (-) Transcript_31774:636-1148(-)